MGNSHGILWFENSKYLPSFRTTNCTVPLNMFWFFSVEFKYKYKDKTTCKKVYSRGLDHIVNF